MAAAYLVQVPPSGGRTLKNGADALIVYAADAADAKAIAKARFTGDSNALWDDAEVTAIAAGADLEGWRLRVVVYNDANSVDVTVTGAGSATIDTIGTLAAAALIAATAEYPDAAKIEDAAYDTGSNVLTIAETTDSLGDKTVRVELLPPIDGSYGDPKTAIPSFVTTVVDGGSSGDALTATLVASTIPAVYGSVAVLG